MALGEHLYAYCGSYSHHGIDMGDGTVIHFDSTPWGKLTSTVNGEQSAATIKRVPFDEFAQGRPIYRRAYGWCLSNELVAQRAQSRLGESGYSLFANNCEHFAVWCKTGQSHSTQIESVIHSVCATARSVPMAMALMRVARATRGRTRLLMMGAAASVTIGTGMTRYIRHRLDNIQNGVS